MSDEGVCQVVLNNNVMTVERADTVVFFKPELLHLMGVERGHNFHFGPVRYRYIAMDYELRAFLCERVDGTPLPVHVTREEVGRE